MRYCFNCGECCARLFNGMVVTRQELSILEINAHKKLPHDIAPNGLYKMKGHTCPFYKDGCSIYEDRPCQCRLFHCGRMKGSDAFLNNLGAVREVMHCNLNYAAERIKMEDAAVKWGNAHGWNWKR